MSVAALNVALGYCGKVPARGDFVADGLAPGFVDLWSQWLQAGLAVSREQLGDAWLEYYLTSPVWHFAIAAEVCGSQAMAGTLIPSVDAVGRHFPFTLVGQTNRTPAALWHDRDWSLAAEQLILQVLDDHHDLNSWADQLAQQPWLASLRDQDELALVATAAGVNSRVYAVDPSAGAAEVLNHLLEQQLRQTCVWWTQGSEHIPPSVLFSAGLPTAGQFAALLDGQWQQWGWM